MTEPFEPPEQLNLADWLLDARVREGKGDRIALRLPDRELTFRDVQLLANRFANTLSASGCGGRSASFWRCSTAPSSSARGSAS